MKGTREELIERKAGLIAACKLTYKELVTELTELVGSINSASNESLSVTENEAKKEDLLVCRWDKCIKPQRADCIGCSELVRGV